MVVPIRLMMLPIPWMPLPRPLLVLLQACSEFVWLLWSFTSADVWKIHASLTTLMPRLVPPIHYLWKNLLKQKRYLWLFKHFTIFSQIVCCILGWVSDQYENQCKICLTKIFLSSMWFSWAISSPANWAKYASAKAVLGQPSLRYSRLKKSYRRKKFLYKTKSILIFRQK